LHNNLDVFLGTNVAGQVRKALEEGGGKKIQEALAEALVATDNKGAKFLSVFLMILTVLGIFLH
jgi:hypothetical protein